MNFYVYFARHHVMIVCLYLSHLSPKAKLIFQQKLIRNVCKLMFDLTKNITLRLPADTLRPIFNKRLFVSALAI